MHRHSPLSQDQIEQLRIQLKKVLEENMIPFEERVISNQLLTKQFNIDNLYQFSRLENERMNKTLENVSQFTFLVMSNFEMIWEEVYHREGKLLELRETFSSATTYIQELKSENEQMKNRLSSAETYIEWIEEQKQYLDAIYDSSKSMIHVSSNTMNRCVSQSNLRWSQNQRKKSVNYQKLKQYIEAIKEERSQLQKQLVNITKRYQIKQEESRKSQLIIEHLVERLHRKQRQSCHSVKMSGQCDTTNQQDLMRMFQKLEVLNSATSLEQNLPQISFQYQQSELSQYFEEKPLMNDNAFKSLNRIESNFSCLSSQKDTKDAYICTQSQLIQNQNVQTQTQNKENKDKVENQQYKISICISGGEKDKKINQLISQLQIQKQLEKKLQKEKDRKKDQIKKQKKTEPIKKVPSILDYYHQKLVSNRIKKYYFRKPDNPNVHSFSKQA